MMNIEEFRTKYPEYNEIDDNTLARSLHEKYYPHVEESKFMEKFLTKTKVEPSPDFVPGGTGGVMMPSHGQQEPERFDIRNTMPSGPIGLVDTAKAMHNLPSSSKDLAINLSKVVTDFPEVVKGIETLASGAYTSIKQGHADPTMLAVKDAINKRYGSWDNFKNTLETDPAGTVVDIAGVMGIAGAALKGVGVLTKTPALSSAGQSLTKTATLSDLPAQAVKVATKATKPIQRTLMKSATKFSKTLPTAERGKLIDTMFKYNILPSEGGVDKVWQLIEQKGAKVQGLIDKAVAEGKTIPRNSMFKYAKDLFDDAKNSGRPLKNPKKVQSIMSEWAKKTKGMREITPEQAQKWKQAIYKEINFDRKRGSAKPMYSEAALKELARGLKEEIEAINPNFKYINAEEGALLNLTEPLMRAANRIADNRVYGMGHFIGSASGVYIGTQMFGVHGGLLGFILGAISSDQKLHAQFAMLLNKAEKLAKKAKTAGQAGNVGLQSSRSKQFYSNTKKPQTNK